VVVMTRRPIINQSNAVSRSPRLANCVMLSKPNKRGDIMRERGRGGGWVHALQNIPPPIP